MKTIILTAACSVTIFGVQAQGIQFESGNWSGVLAKAKKEHRLVYVDAYTTWCGPCKMLATNIFPTKEAGEYYNAHFVNYRVDAEKGEGIDIAKQYAVTGYPTHLYIDPETSAVVYRGMGYSPEVKDFIKEGQVAELEWIDPMTWQKYGDQFPTRKSDTAFLKKYLQKAERLDKDNVEILNAYVVALGNRKPSDAEVQFLFEHIRTIDNNAVNLVTTYRTALKSEGDKDPLDSRQERWIFKTMEKAVATKDESLLEKIRVHQQAVMPAKAEEQFLYIRSRYYQEVGDQDGAAKAAAEEAKFLSSKPAAQFAKEDAEGVEQAKEQIRWQLKEMKVPKEKWDELTEVNLKKNPSMSHSASARAAQTLNGSAWNVYENSSSNAALVQQALAWSKKSLELAEGLDDVWPAFADTYAHLLFVSGDKAAAVKYEQMAVDKLKAAGSQELPQYQDALEKMKSGKL